MFAVPSTSWQVIFYLNITTKIEVKMIGIGCGHLDFPLSCAAAASGYDWMLCLETISSKSLDQNQIISNHFGDRNYLNFICQFSPNIVEVAKFYANKF